MFSYLSFQEEEEKRANSGFSDKQKSRKKQTNYLNKNRNLPI